uniref:Homing endonuclease LAGLIDADG domain-containing protein n=1 Tax=Monosporozyma unispora TaxID=27294 RepID=A0A2D0W3T4_9SACH|nr:hypothetical protein [Kazachstania unispora]APD15118.1 hypothetical protein [Kazachstania unispora]
MMKMTQMNMKAMNSTTSMEFKQWFVGFSDAEGMFMLSPYYSKDKLKIKSWSFMYSVTLHIDDIQTLKTIKENLNLTKEVTLDINENLCRLRIQSKEELMLLMRIFDEFPLNTTKYLNYLDFKRAFNLYYRTKIRTYELDKELLNIKNMMNNKRTDFDINNYVKYGADATTWDNHIKINRYWLLGMVEGDGSFNYSREEAVPTFMIMLTETEKCLLYSIKDFLKNNLGFDKYSLMMIENSPVIGVRYQKGRMNSKPTWHLKIKNRRVLYTYLIPFFDNMTFFSKKNESYQIWRMLCLAVYSGIYTDPKIKHWLTLLSYNMNSFSLSTYNDKMYKNDSRAERVMISEEIKQNIINEANNNPKVKYLKDGRVMNLDTNKIIHSYGSSMYMVKNGEEIKVFYSLLDCAKYLNIMSTTLSRNLILSDSSWQWVKKAKVFVRRMPTFQKD